MRYVTVGDVLLAYEQEVGPPDGVNHGLLESAVMRPQASAGGDEALVSVHRKAAALLQGLIRNHPFIDGNKRTAWLSVVLFYALNGYSTMADDGDVYDVTNATTRGDVDLDELEDWLATVVHDELSDDERARIDA